MNDEFNSSAEQPQQENPQQPQPQQNPYAPQYQQQNPYAQPSTFGQPQQSSYTQQYQQQTNPYAQQGYQPQQNPYNQQYQQPSYTAGYYQYNPAASVQSADTDGFAIASLITGIVGILTCCTFLPSILGLIFGIVSKAKYGKTRPGGVSTAGIILSVIGLLLSIFWLMVFTMGGGDPSQTI